MIYILIGIEIIVGGIRVHLERFSAKMVRWMRITLLLDDYTRNTKMPGPSQNMHFSLFN